MFKENVKCIICGENSIIFDDEYGECEECNCKLSIKSWKNIYLEQCLEYLDNYKYIDILDNWKSDVKNALKFVNEFFNEKL